MAQCLDGQVFLWRRGKLSREPWAHTTLLFIIRLRARCYLYFIFFHISYKKPVGRSIPFIDQFISTEVEGERERKDGQKRQRESWPKRFPACAHRWEYHIEKNKKKKKSLLTRTQFDYEAPLRCKREVVEVTYSKYWGPDGYDESSTLSSGRLKGPSRAATGELAPSYNQTFIFRAPSNAREVGLICSPTYI